MIPRVVLETNTGNDGISAVNPSLAFLSLAVASSLNE